VFSPGAAVPCTDSATTIALYTARNIDSTYGVTNLVGMWRVVVTVIPMS